MSCPILPSLSAPSPQGWHQTEWQLQEDVSLQHRLHGPAAALREGPKQTPGSSAPASRAGRAAGPTGGPLSTPRRSRGHARSLGQGPGDMDQRGMGDTGCRLPEDLVGLMAEGGGRAARCGAGSPPHCVRADGGGPPGCARFLPRATQGCGEGLQEERARGESASSSFATGRGNSPLLC